jgi:hypothetical protein
LPKATKYFSAILSVYSINKNVALGVLKPQIIPLFLAKEPKEIIYELVSYFVKNKILVYPNKKPLKR